MTAPPPLNQHDTGIRLIGGGGHALVVADSASEAGITIAGFFDDANNAPLLSGQPSADRLGELRGLDANALVGKPWILCVGDLGIRRALVDRLYAAEEDASTIVHPGAIVSEHAIIAAGVFVGPGAIINAGARILDHAIVNSGAIVEHDCLISENAHIAPGAVLGGNVTIGNDTLVGLGARVLPGITIGQRCKIGAGAVVIRDVGDGATVAGCPAV